jgi:hypothetical protein
MSDLLGTIHIEKPFGELFKRVSRLEMMVTAPGITGADNTDFPDGVTIGGVPVDTDLPVAATGLTATPGAFMDDIYVDLDWTASTAPNAASYQIELATKAGAVYTVINQFQTIPTTLRIENLLPNQDYGVRVYTVSTLGLVGPASAWVDFTAVPDTTIPGTVTGVAAYRGAASVVAVWNENAEADVAHGNGLYEVQVSTDNTFVTILQTVRTSAIIVAFDGINAEATYYVRVSAIDASGNQGPWSATANTLGGGITDSMVLAQLSAAKITVGVMSGDRINVNTLNADRLKTSSLTAGNITIDGGSLRAGSTDPASAGGVLLNSGGLSLYNPSGTRTVFLDASSGSATFTGTVSGSIITGQTTIQSGSIRTSSGFPRIELSSTAQVFYGFNTHALQIYDSNASQNQPAFVYNFGDGDASSLVLAGGKIASSGGGSTIPELFLTTFRLGSVQSQLQSNAQQNLFTGQVVCQDQIALTTGVTSPSILENSSTETSPHNGTQNTVGPILRGIHSVSLFTEGYLLFRAGYGQIDLYEVGYAHQDFNVEGDLNVDGNAALTGGAGVTGTLVANDDLSVGGHSYLGDTDIGFLTAGTIVCTAGTQTVDLLVTGNGEVDGDLNVIGNFSSGNKYFEIRHPVLGREWLLRHSSVESPQADLIYRGMAHLENGVAVIDVDAWYGMTPGTLDALLNPHNRQVFLFNESGGNRVTYSLDGARLTIRGPRQATVGWMLIGERADPTMVGMPSTDESGHVIVEAPRDHTKDLHEIKVSESMLASDIMLWADRKDQKGSRFKEMEK